MRGSGAAMNTRSPSRMRSNSSPHVVVRQAHAAMRQRAAERVFLVGAVEIDVARERVAARPAIDAVLEPVERQDAGQDQIVVAGLAAPGLAGRLARHEHRAGRRVLRRSAHGCDASLAACGTSSPRRRCRFAPWTPARRRPPSRLRPECAPGARHRPPAAARATRPARRGATGRRAQDRGRGRKFGSEGAVTRALCHNGSARRYPLISGPA